jgi:hypothetical protein
VPGETVWLAPAAGLSRPCAEVSPIATFAHGFYDLIAA